MGPASRVNQSELQERLAGFYAAHWSRLWAYLVRLGADPASAQDVAQDAFARWALSPAPQWEERRGRAYLYTIAYRALIDFRRKGRREEPLQEEAAAPVLAGDRPLPGAWQKLSERERQLLWLAYAEEFAHEEIAAITGLRAGSLKVLLSRARDRARNLLGGVEE